MRSSSRSYLGVDIGAASIRLVELRRVSGLPELGTYGIAELPLGAPTDKERPVSEVASTLRSLLKQTHASTKLAYGALPTHAIFTSIVSLPKLKAKELSAAVAEETQKLLPLPVSDMVLDPQALGPSADGKSVRVLVVAAPKQLVERYDAIFKEAQLELLGLETEGFALIRSLVGDDPAPVAVLDFGAHTTDITIVDGTAPVLNRSITVGGRQLTADLAAALSLTPTDAEQVKRDIGLGTTGDALSPLVLRTIQPLMNEARYTLQLFQERSGKHIEKIILAGGSAILLGLVAYVEKTLGLRTYIGDPWARVRHPLELAPLLQMNAARYGVAVGLAMRAIKG